MTEIEKQALALLNEVNMERNRKGATFVFVDRSSCVLTEALCRAIEQHKHFKREVSDAIIDCGAERYLARFILPKPVDPLVEAMSIATANSTVLDGETETEARCRVFRAALAKRGLEVREIEG